MATDTTAKKSWVQKTPGVCGGRACIRKGIISCTQDPSDPAGLAQRIHDAITVASDLANRLIRVVRPNRPANP